MNYDLTGGTPPKATGSPIEDNYTVSEGYPMGGNIQPGAGNPSEDQSAHFFNGNSDKPFPEDRNFIQDVSATQPIGMGNYTPSTANPDIRLGQEKYAKRAGAVSVYKDETRNTADDDAASAKTLQQPAPNWGEYMNGEEGEESQGGSI